MQYMIIYHADCPDGFTAAWLMWNGLGSFPQGYSGGTMIPGKYGTPPPLVPPNTDVFLVDFCYEPEHLRQLAKEANSLTILDHHQTALGWCEEAFPGDVIETWHHTLAGVKGVTVIDQKQSGAGLAALWTGKRVPFVKYIEDRDLWRWQFGDTTKHVFAAVTSRPYEIAHWDEMADLPISDLIHEGEAINRYRDQLIQQVLKEAYQIPMFGYDGIWIVACPYAIGSDVAGILAERDPERFAAYYVDKPNYVRRWGLRSLDPSGMDVATLAQTRGGGGHPHASGFETAREML